MLMAIAPLLVLLPLDMARDAQRSSDVRVGLFVALGITATLLSLFVIGAERKLWERSAHLKARFTNVAGLKVGAQVRLAGISVGIVNRIDLPVPDPTADARLVPAIKLSELMDAERRKLKSSKAGKIEDVDMSALDVPLIDENKKLNFESPINLSLVLTDPQDALEATIEVVGVDMHGSDARERILARVRRGQTAVLGTVIFKSVHSIRLQNLKDTADIKRGKRSAPFAGCTLQVGDGTSRKVTVDMRVSANIMERVRTDSVAAVQNEGLLGDKFIDISIGTLSKPEVPDRGLLLADEGVDLAAALASTGEIIDNVNGSTESIRALLEGFRKAGGEQTVVAAVRSIQALADEVRDGDGLLHQVIFDESGGTAYKEILSNVNASTRKVDSGLAKVDGILADLRTNQSLAHELLYGDQGELTVSEARRLLAATSTVVEDIKTKEGLLHNLIYQEDKGAIMGNINAASGDVRAIVADVRDVVASVKQGKGTVGQLLADPSVYEDLKALVGDARRSGAVKMLVRYAIEQDEQGKVKPK
jgi:phospholipid/cholesterol/gamma-HCH transport system substrate-binding protein